MTATTSPSSSSWWTPRAVFKFRRLRRWLFVADPLETPLELRHKPAYWQEVFRSPMKFFPIDEVRRFVRTNVGDGAEFYSVGSGRKTLIVVFMDSKRRLLMHIAVFLQHLDGEEFDVLALHESQQLHFDSGAGESASSFAALIDFVAEFVTRNGYRNTITYGASMGGFPALRAGHRLKADRAISVGGSFAWHVGRIKNRGRTIGAFDPLCECNMPIRCPAFLLYAENNAEDAENVARATAIVSDATVIPVPTSDHLFPFKIYQRGNLEEYHRQIFDLDRNPDSSRLGSLLDGPHLSVLPTRRQPSAHSLP